MSAFFTGMSEIADILVLEVSNDGLSFETIKSKIKNVAAAGLVRALADPLLRVNEKNLTLNIKKLSFRLKNLTLNFTC